jgi:hypothetical protein
MSRFFEIDDVPRHDIPSLLGFPMEPCEWMRGLKVIARRECDETRTLYVPADLLEQLRAAPDQAQAILRDVMVYTIPAPQVRATFFDCDAQAS